MQAESFKITKRSLIVAPGIVFAQGCHSLLAAEFRGWRRELSRQPQELTLSFHLIRYPIVRALLDEAHVAQTGKEAILWQQKATTRRCVDTKWEYARLISFTIVATKDGV